MKISIFGANCLAHFLAQQFENDPLVSEIFLYNVSQQVKTTNKCTLVSMQGENNLTGFKNFFLNEVNLLKSREVDLVIDTTLMSQLWKEFNVKLHETKIPLLIPPCDAGFLEWSKVKSKLLINELGIPTPRFEIVDLQTAIDNFKLWPVPYVLKFDQDYREGLQTLVITDHNINECYNEFLLNGSQRDMKALGQFVDQQFIKEEFIQGREYSYHVLCNGETVEFLGAARDYKKRFENDKGFNTVGMGSYSPVDGVDHSVLAYAQKIVDYLNSQGIKYKGIMYLGIMVVNDIPLLLEVNTRFGDPEFSTIAPTIDSSLAQLFYDAATGKTLTKTKFNQQQCATIRLVHKDYNLEEKHNATPPKIDNLPDDIVVSYANGFKNFNSMLTSSGKHLNEAVDRIYNYLQNKDLGDFTYRKDIGYFK